MRSQVAMEARLWYLQRISAMVLGICVLVHLAGIIYAVHGGLSGAEILARTQGNWGLGLFYTTFVLACAVHVPIGIINVAREWLGWSIGSARMLGMLSGLLILVMGLRAVTGVTMP